MKHYHTCKKFLKLLSLSTGVLFFFSGCSNTKMNNPNYVCPPIYLIEQTKEHKVYERSGQEKPAGMVLKAKITDFRGKCVYKKNKATLNIALSVDFEILRGPKNRNRKIDFQYFVAIPKFYPEVEGKKIFSISDQFGEHSKRRRIVDELVITMPVEVNQSFAQYPIYIGFQISPSVIENNQ